MLIAQILARIFARRMVFKVSQPSADLQAYEGGRYYDSLKKFAEENLGPQCGPQNLDLCDEKRKKKLESFMAMSLERMEAKVTNSIRVYEEEVPLMRKVAAWMKTKGGKADL